MPFTPSRIRSLLKCSRGNVRKGRARSRRIRLERLENRVVLSADSLFLAFGETGDIPVAGSDFDGDGKSDVTVFRPSTGSWFSATSGSGFNTAASVREYWQYGQNGDIPIGGADFNGDGKSDLAVYRPGSGQWFAATSDWGFNLGSSATTSAFVLPFGEPGDIPVAGTDFDGDGRTDITVFRPSTGQWFSATSDSGYSTDANVRKLWDFGQNGDIPVGGSDFDGDGRTDLVVFRPSNGFWYASTSSSGYEWDRAATSVTFVLAFGNAGDVPIAGSDFDGDGRTDISVFRPSTGEWFSATSGSGFNTDPSVRLRWSFGQNGDIPIGRSDFDGNGRSEVGVFRPSSGNWFAAPASLQPGQDPLPVVTVPSGTVDNTNYDVALAFQIAIDTDAAYGGNLTTESASLVQEGTVLATNVPSGFVVAPAQAQAGQVAIALEGEDLQLYPKSSLNGDGASNFEESTAMTVTNVAITVVGTAAAVFRPSPGGTALSMAFGLRGKSSLSASEFIAEGNVDVNIGSESYVANGTPVRVRDGAKVSGRGSMRDKVFVGQGGTRRATVSPGDSPGILHVQDIYFDSNGALEIELFGNTVGSGYDQLHVTGDVSLGGAHLDVGLGFSPALGQEFMIIRNDGNDPVSGTFQGLPEGASLDIGGKRFHITYRGGTGNDVVLRRNERPTGGSLSRSTDEDVVLAGTVSNSDPDGDSVTVELVTGPEHAAGFALNGDGSFIYTPIENFAGVDSFTYRVTDGELLSSDYIVDIDVHPIADVPMLVIKDAVGDENSQIPLSISSALVDLDGSEMLALRISGVPGGATLNQGTDLGGGVWSLTPSQIDGLTLQSLNNQSFSLHVSATATETATGQPATASEPLVVTVNNVLPSLEVMATSEIDEDGEVTLTGTITDPGTLDVFTLQIDWGDPLSPGNVQTFSLDASPTGSQAFTFTHRYLDDNPTRTATAFYDVMATVTDDVGSVITQSKVTVNNLAPENLTLNAPVISENGTATVIGSFTDVGTLDTHDVVIDWGDGTTSIASVDPMTRTFMADHQYLDDSPTGSASDVYDITATVTDDDGGSVAVQSTVTVNNLAPENLSFDNVTFGAPISPGNIGGVPGQTLWFVGSFVDVGTLDTHSASVDWGDGSATEDLLLKQSVGAGTIFGNHIYLTAGSYTVTVTVNDDDGGSISRTFELSLADTALLPDTYQAGTTALYVGGTTGDDDILVKPVDGAGAVEAIINGVSQGSFIPSGRIVVFAQSGNDDVQVAGSVENSAWLYGGQGDDRLKGGNGNDVLLGEEGDDLIVGGKGRDFAIGGYGADRIVGNADDDILIAGRLEFARRDQALYDILDEWTSHYDQKTRIENLNSLLVLGQTVVDDQEKDTLTGSAGDDWFFFDQDKDKATDLKDEVFANDLTWIQS